MSEIKPIDSMNTGYPTYDQTKIPPKYICIKCSSIYVNVVQADCGCRYCSLCLDELLQSKIQPVCFTCKLELSKDYKMFDKAFQKELNNISIDCIKCKWKGKLCEYRQHYDKEHPYFICNYCNKTFSELKELNSHLNNDECLLKPMKCPFSEANCNEIVTKSTLEQHLKSNAHLHLQNMYNHVTKQITKIEEEQHSSQQTVPLDGSNSQIKITIATNTLGASVITSNNPTTSKAVVSKIGKPDETLINDIVSSTIDTDLVKFSNIESEQKVVNDDLSIHKQLYDLLKEDISYIKNKEKKLRDELDQLNKSLSVAQNSIISLEDRLLTQENASYNGVLIWKITNVQEKMLEARNGQQTSICSQSFYTTSWGYKMCGRVYLNGDGMGRGTHLSLFFSIMKGEHDALLKWPFRQKVTFILMDQSTTKKENIIDAFRPDPNSSSFKRPTSEMNVASGIPLFFALTKLLADDHEYIKDDTLYIKIVVDIRDLVDV